MNPNYPIREQSYRVCAIAEQGVILTRRLLAGTLPINQ